MVVKAPEPSIRELVREAVSDAVRDVFSDRVPAHERLVVKPALAGGLLSQSVSTVYELMSSGELEFVRIGNSRLIPVAALRDLIARRAQQARDGEKPER